MKVCSIFILGLTSMFKAERAVAVSWWEIGVRSKRTGVCCSSCCSRGTFSSKHGSEMGLLTAGTLPVLLASCSWSELNEGKNCLNVSQNQGGFGELTENFHFGYVRSRCLLSGSWYRWPSSVQLFHLRIRPHRRQVNWLPFRASIPSFHLDGA